MSAALGDDDFYSNLMQYMNQDSLNPFLNSTAMSLSPHEAEKHTLDDDDSVMDEGESKRRESTNSQAMDSGSDETDNKVTKKKPGRKMMLTEPANKRKAQNRAAQRAFRERKEAHVKGLETRVTELEEITQSKDNENQDLKNQVQALQAELMALRGGSFNFDFAMKNVQSTTAPTINNSSVRNPFQNGQTNGQQTSPSPSSGSATDATSVFRSGQSSLATSPDDVNKSTPNIDIPFELFSNSAGPVNFTNNSNNTSPLFTNDLFGNSPSQNGIAAPLFGQNRSQNTSPLLDTFAQTLASLTQQNQTPPSITGSFNTTMPSSTSTAPLSSFSPTPATAHTSNLFDMNDPLFNTWRDNSISSQGGEENFDIFDTMFSSMSPGAFNLVDTTGLDLTDFITDPPPTQPTNANGEPSITCPEIWDKVKNHPQFDDIDIDQLCSEMRSKAKCSNSGSLVSARGLDETLSRFVKSS